MLLLIGKGISEETQSERYVMIESTSLSQLHLKMCASNDNIETCGTWSYPSSYNCTSHFYVHSVNKDNDLQGKYTSHVHKISMNQCVNSSSSFKYAILFPNLEQVQMQLLPTESSYWDTDIRIYSNGSCVHISFTVHSDDYWMDMDLQSCNKKGKANQEER